MCLFTLLSIMLAAAAETAASSNSRPAAGVVRVPVTQPSEVLRPYTEFLRAHGEDPEALLLRAVKTHRLTIIGEIHHRPLYWELNTAIVRDDAFPESVGTIYLELPSHSQPLIDAFLSSARFDPAPVIETLRDMLWMGWPDQAMLEFFRAVWDVNAGLPAARHIRVLAVDMPRPWSRIRHRSDWRQFEPASRDVLMADNILNDLQASRGDSRHALFIVGVGHAAIDLRLQDGSPLLTAGHELARALGRPNVFVSFPHTCAMSNIGQVNGRLAAGLFESALAAAGKTRIGFPLDSGPFGECPFDAFPEHAVSSHYREGFDAYIYLGPLEDEVFSPLIPGFYTDAFVQELDRRHQVTFGRGLVEGCGLSDTTAAEFLRWMENSWGKPRREWRRLGPVDAWTYGGGDWRQAVREARLREAATQPAEIEKAAGRLIEAIRAADCPRGSTADAASTRFLAEDVHYAVRQDYPAWVSWICRHLRGNPIMRSDLGPVTIDKSGRPCVMYRLLLQDGTALRGKLPFDYDPAAQTWTGVEGLDWHLLYPKGLPSRRE